MMDRESGAVLLEPVDLAAELQRAIEQGDTKRSVELAYQFDEGTAGDLFDTLSDQQLERLFLVLGDETFADLVVRLDDHDAADVLERIDARHAADILEELDPDDATDIFSELDPAFSNVILVQMEPDEAAEMQELLAYPADSAGGQMTPAFVAVAPTLRAEQAVAALRRVAEEAETINYVYVTDPEYHLLGVLSLHRLVLTPPNTPVADLMYTRPVTVQVDADQEEAARLLMEHDLLALPVIDRDNRILGIITVDDIADVLEREATEDFERLGGSAPLTEPYLRASPVHLFRKRVVWLFVLFLAQFVTVSIIGHYEGLIAQATILSLFIPILIGTGGNIGSQTVSTLIRAIGVGEVTTRDTATVVGKEFLTGAALGLVMAFLMFGRALLTGDSTTSLAITVALTVLFVATWAATVGAVLPIVLNRLRVDPAVVSAPLITSLVDGTGLIIYFTVARLVMDLN